MNPNHDPSVKVHYLRIGSDEDLPPLTGALSRLLMDLVNARWQVLNVTPRSRYDWWMKFPNRQWPQHHSEVNPLVDKWWLDYLRGRRRTMHDMIAYSGETVVWCEERVQNNPWIIPADLRCEHPLF